METSNFIQGYICPVCGFGMSNPPADFSICPSCGTEFGNDDLDWSYEDIRAQWVAGGLQWWSNSHPEPPRWDPLLQLLEVTQVKGSWNIDTTIIPADNQVYFDEPFRGYWQLSAAA